MPSRAAYGTGLMPHAIGITVQDPLNDDCRWIAHFFKDASYHTIKTGGFMVDNISCLGWL
jgi:arylsulfatase A-like enzyme